MSTGHPLGQQQQQQQHHRTNSAPFVSGSKLPIGSSLPSPPSPPSYYLPQSFLPPLPYDLPLASSSTSPGLSMREFDPKASPSDDDEEASEEEDTGMQSGRPRKRKSVANLRGAAATGGHSSPVKAATAGNEDEEKGKRKMTIEYIEEKSKRHITFSKRKAGIMKKAYELSTLTGTQILLLVVSESGWVYTFTTDKFKPLVKEDENGNLSAGQKLIASCLENAPPDSSMSNGPPTHGGAIALRANPRSVATPRPILTNRRVSTSSPAKPRPPPLPTLPIPYSSAESALPSSPLRGLPSAARRGIQQQQMMNPSGMTRCPSGSGTGGGGQDYAEMLQRAEMMQVQNQRQQMYDGAAATYESGYGSQQQQQQQPPSLSSHSSSSHLRSSYQSSPLPSPHSGSLQSQQSAALQQAQHASYPAPQSLYAEPTAHYTAQSDANYTPSDPYPSSDTPFPYPPPPDSYLSNPYPSSDTYPASETYPAAPEGGNYTTTPYSTTYTPAPNYVPPTSQGTHRRTGSSSLQQQLFGDFVSGVAGER